MNNYESPTTPGLRVDFRNYIIELVCLNCNNKLKPRFWKSEDFWKNKYKREIKGFHNLKILLEQEFSLEDNIIKKIIISNIKKNKIKSLLFKKTLNRIFKNIKIEYLIEKNKPEKLQKPKVTDIDNYIDNNIKTQITKTKNKLSKIREIENG